MYKLTTQTGKVFTIPKQNIGLLTYTKAQDMKAVIDPKDEKLAISFLEALGIKVENYEEKEEIKESENV